MVNRGVPAPPVTLRASSFAAIACAMPKRLQQLMSWLILALSLGAVAHILWHQREAFALLGDIGAGVLIAILALKCAYFVVHCFRYQIVLEKCSGRPVAFGPWFRVYTLGNFANAIVPQLGNVYRGVQLKQNFGVAYTHFISTLLSVAWIGSLFNLLAVVVIVAVLSPGLALWSLPAWLLMSTLTVIVLATPFAANRLLRAVRLRRRPLAWVQAKMSDVLHISATLLRDRVFVARLMALVVVLFAMACGLFYLCFLAIQVRIGFVELTLFFALLQIVSYVQLTPGNIGVAELAYGLLSDQLGFGMAEGILAGTILRAAGYANILALAVPMGGIGLLRNYARSRDRRQTA